MNAAVASSSNDSWAITWHQWQAAYPTRQQDRDVARAAPRRTPPGPTPTSRRGCRRAGGGTARSRTRVGWPRLPTYAGPRWPNVCCVLAADTPSTRAFRSKRSEPAVSRRPGCRAASPRPPARRGCRMPPRGRGRAAGSCGTGRSTSRVIALLRGAVSRPCSRNHARSASITDSACRSLSSPSVTRRSPSGSACCRSTNASSDQPLHVRPGHLDHVRPASVRTPRRARRRRRPRP